MLIGLDVGTTSVKAVAYDPDPGRALAIVSHPTPIVHPRPGWSDFPPEALWEAVVATVRDLTARLPAETRVEALGIASVGEAGLPLDTSHTPLYPIIAWFDPRGEEYTEAWRRRFPERELYTITGHTVRSLYTVFKLLWLWDHHPEVMARMATWLFVGDYIAFRMTGEVATVTTLAARSLLFDVVRRQWNPDLVAAARLRVDQLPPVVEAGTPVGRLRAEVARAMGLPAGLPVTLAGHDHPVGMLAAGLYGTQSAVDSSGTAQAIATLTPHFIGPRGCDAGVTCYPFVVGGVYLLQGGMATAGAALQWLADLITEGDVARLLALAERAPAGSRGAGCVPFFRGTGTPYRRPGARAAFFNLDLDHGPEEVARALVEGLACFLAENIALLEGLVGRTVGEIRAIGGGNRSPFLLRVKASMVRRPLLRVDVPEAVGTSAALIAGLACGRFATPEEAVASLDMPTTAVAPVPEWSDVYDEVYARYRQWATFAVNA